MEGKNIKFLLIIGAVSFLIASVFFISFGFMRRANMMGYGKNINARYGVPGRVGMMYPSNQNNDFVLPLDAAKSGELAVIVDDLDGAKNKISEIALQNDGEIYATHISYSSSEVKNGLIVLRMPADKFENAFSTLRSSGFKVVQESSRKVQPTLVYPLNQNVAAGEQIKAQESQSSEEKADSGASNAQSEPSQGSPEAQGGLQPEKVISAQAQIQTQDKGYIKVVLADYGKSGNFGLAASQNRSGMMFFQSQPQNFSKVMWIGLAIKMIVLIAMFVLLVVVSIRMIVSFRKHRIARKSSQTKPLQKKAVLHVIRKSPKSKV